MKKHELLKYAYDNYPKGTVARFKSAPYVDHTSDGVFKFLDIKGEITIFSGSGLNCFYNDGDWAEVVKEGEELGTFQAPYDSLIITPQQIEELKEQGVDILKLTEKFRDDRK